MIANPVKQLADLLKIKDIDIYDTCFKMHTKLTSFFLILFSILVTYHSYTGKPINCLIKNRDLKSIVETICWVNGTFTFRNVSTMVNGREIWKQIPQYQGYYQWIAITLFLQAVLFTVPHSLWKYWEHGRIQQLCGSFSSSIVYLDYPDYAKGKQRIVSYLRMNNSRIHGAYVSRYVVCEILNFLIVVANMYILNVIFDQFWSRYLPAVLAIFTTGEMSKFSKFSTLASDLFPITTKCTYYDYGPSGSQQIHDTLCQLTSNIMNEKVFAFLYIWYVLLLVLSGLNLICRSVIMLSSTIRCKLIQSLSAWTVPLSSKKLKIILKDDNIGDWFIIFRLGQTINRSVFRDILDELADEGNDMFKNVSMLTETLCEAKCSQSLVQLLPATTITKTFVTNFEKLTELSTYEEQ